MKISADSGQNQRQKKHAERRSLIPGITVLRHSLQLVLTDAVHPIDILADQPFKFFVIPLFLSGIAQMVFHRLAHLLDIFLLLADPFGSELLQLILAPDFLFQFPYLSDPGILYHNLRILRKHSCFVLLLILHWVLFPFILSSNSLIIDFPAQKNNLLFPVFIALALHPVTREKCRKYRQYYHNGE